jgi:hypothetical protein
MFAYYDQDDNKLLGHAHSLLPCHRQDEGDEHLPHVHDKRMELGPFLCPGLPEVATYTMVVKQENYPDPILVQRVERLRRQVHVHSMLYYHLHTSVISDAEFDRMSNDLVVLQKAHPELQDIGHLAEEFSDWTGETGMHLPVTDRAMAVAHQLLAANER